MTTGAANCTSTLRIAVTRSTRRPQFHPEYVVIIAVSTYLGLPICSAHCRLCEVALRPRCPPRMDHTRTGQKQRIQMASLMLRRLQSSNVRHALLDRRTECFRYVTFHVFELQIFRSSCCGGALNDKIRHQYLIGALIWAVYPRTLFIPMHIALTRIAFVSAKLEYNTTYVLV